MKNLKSKIRNGAYVLLAAGIVSLSIGGASANTLHLPVQQDTSKMSKMNKEKMAKMKAEKKKTDKMEKGKMSGDKMKKDPKGKM